MELQDLDDLMRENRTRPSALLGFYGLLGATLGRAAQVIPVACVATALTSVVHEVAEQSLNDGIRDLAGTGDADADVREGLKYHRDLRASYGSSDGAAAAAAAAGEGGGGGGYSVQLEAARAMLTTSLANAVKVADTI